MELTIPTLIRMPHPLRKLRSRHNEVEQTGAPGVIAMIPRPRTSNEQISARTVDALVKRG